MFKAGTERPLEISKNLTLRTMRSCVSCSLLTMFKACPRKFFFTYVLGLEPIRKPIFKPLIIGQFIHAILAQCYLKKELTQKTLNTVYKLEVKPLLDERHELAAKDKVAIGFYDNDDVLINECWDLARATCTVFWKKYPLAKNTEIHFTETMFVTHGDEASYVGILDTVMQETGNYPLWIVDHKSTSAIPSLRMTGLEYAYQTVMYPDLLRRYYLSREQASRQVAGMIYNIIQKPTIKFCGKDKTFDDYIDRCVEWYAAKEKKGEKPMDTCILPTGSEGWGTRVVNSGVASHISSVARLLYHTSQGKAFNGTDLAVAWPFMFPCEESACRGKYETTECLFYPLCSMDPGGWEGLIGTAYHQGFSRVAPESDEENTLVTRVEGVKK